MFRAALLMMVCLTGTAAELRVNEGSNFALALSPDGATLALDLQGSLQLLPSSGGASGSLTDGRGDDRLPSWSPNGERLAFQSFRDGRWHIWSMRRDGRELRQHTRGPMHAREPAWSADGRELIFSSDRAGNLDLWAINIASGEWRALTSDPGDDYLPAVGADGDLWFVSDRDGTPAVWQLGADGRQTLLANTDQSPASGLSLSPDGRQLAWITATEKIGFPAAARHAIVVYDLAAGSGRLLANAGLDVFPFAPQWRDNTSLLYSADGGIRQQRIDGDEPSQAVSFSAVFDVDPQKPPIRSALQPQTSTNPALGLQSPLAGPDGSVIFTALGDIWQRSREGTLRKLTNDSALERDLSFAADNNELLFIADRNGAMQTWSLELSSGDRQLVTDAAGLRFPTPSPDGQLMAYLQVGPRGTQDFSLRLLDRASGKTRRLRSLPGLWPERMAWSADGQHLLVTALQPASARFRAGSNVLLHVDVAADRFEVLSDLPILDEGVALSARGDRLALVSNGQLWTLKLQSNGRPNSPPLRLLDELVSDPAWARDGQALLVMGPQGLSQVSRGGELQYLPVDLTWKSAVNAEKLLLHAGRMFSGHGEGYRADVDILIEQGVIRSVTAHRDHNTGLTVIDAGDATVLPGLIDHHAHFEGHQGGWIGRAWLAFGVTSVVEPGGLPYASRALMEAWESGRRAGPRLFFAGPQLDGERKFFPFASHIKDDTRLRQEFARGERLGYSLVKTYTHMPVQRQLLAIELAQRTGLPLSSHALFPALGSGAQRVEHLRGSSRLGYSSKQTALLRSYGDVIALAAASRGSITPTLVVSGGFFDFLDGQPQLNELPQYQAFYDKRYRGGLAALLKLLLRRGDLLPTAAANARRAVRDYHRAGVQVVAGTDSPIFPYGLALIAELAGYVEAGLRPSEALRTATINAAAALGAEGELGVIAPGARADLIIVEGDPLSRMEDLFRLRGSLRGGIYYPLEELLQKTASPTPSPAR